MRYWLILVLSLACHPALAETQHQIELTTQLLNMAEQSSVIQKQLAKSQKSAPHPSLLNMAQQLSTLHNQTLQAIIAKHGWPNKSLVGEEGVKAAFKIVQNAEDLVFQQQMLPLVLQSFLAQDGLSGQEVAEFTDQTWLKLGKKQVFGTQYSIQNGQSVLAPIDNPETVDQLRLQLGLASLAEYQRAIQLKD